MTSTIIIILGLALPIILILLPSILTGDWHKDRMDSIERGDPYD